MKYIISCNGVIPFWNVAMNAVEEKIMNTVKNAPEEKEEQWKFLSELEDLLAVRRALREGKTEWEE